MVWGTILGALSGKAGQQPKEAAFTLEEVPVAQMGTGDLYNEESLTIPRDQRKRQQPMSVLSGMGGSGGYYQ